MSDRGYFLVGFVACTISFCVASFLLRISPSSRFQTNWHMLKREGDHFLMNVIDAKNYTLAGYSFELLWQGGEASGHTMGCVVNLSRIKAQQSTFIAAFAGLCPQEFGSRGMIDQKFEEFFWLCVIGAGIILIDGYLLVRWYMYRNTWLMVMVVGTFFGLLGLHIAHLFPWAVVFDAPVAVRQLFPG